MDNKGQISTEMLLLMAALLAVAVLFINALKTSASPAESKMISNAKKAIKAGVVK